MNQKFCTKKELANLMGISYKTFYRWLRKYGVNYENKLLSPKEQKEIFEAFGLMESMSGRIHY